MMRNKVWIIHVIIVVHVANITKTLHYVINVTIGLKNGLK